MELVSIFQYTEKYVGNCQFFRTENGEWESETQYTELRIQVKVTDKHKVSAEKTGRLKFRNIQLTKALR